MVVHTEASGKASHAEGNGTKAKGMFAHTEGTNTTATGNAAHAEGDRTKALGNGSPSDGFETGTGDETPAEGEEGEEKETLTIQNFRNASYYRNFTLEFKGGVTMNIADEGSPFLNVVASDANDTVISFFANSTIHALFINSSKSRNIIKL